MKKIAFYIISLLACIGLASSCSSDDDEMDFSDGTELTIGGEEINSVTDVSNEIPYNVGYSDTCIIRCFHSEEEAMACKDMNSRDSKVTIPPIDWESQTLVLAMYRHPNLIEYAGCKVIKKGKRYLVELSYNNLIGNAFWDIAALIVVNKPDLTDKNFSIKPVCLTPTSPKEK